MRRAWGIGLVVLVAGASCARRAPATELRASGYVEATEVRIASKVAGRVATVAVAEGQRVTQGAIIVTLDTAETDLALRRARADRAQADAQYRLLRAGARSEDIRQAGAQVGAASSDVRGADADLASARADEQRYEHLLQTRAGSEKQRDDAVTRRQMAEARLAAAQERVHGAEEALARLKAGARQEEIDGAAAKVVSIDAQIATLEHDKAEAVIVAPTAGVVTSRLVEPGELVAPRTPLLVIVDLDRAWANIYVEEPRVPGVALDQPAVVLTDGGQRIEGRVAFISPQAEFTPRNVQTADERAKLVYRVKVLVDNTSGLLKPGMPVEAEFGPIRPIQK